MLLFHQGYDLLEAGIFADGARIRCRDLGDLAAVFVNEIGRRLVACLALAFPLAGLAESTSIATLAVFALVNLALLRLKFTGQQSPGTHVHVSVWIPVAGFASCMLMIVAGLA